MRKGIGIFCIVLGVLCLLVAVGCVGYNRREAQVGEQSSQTLLQNVQANMDAPPLETQPEDPTEETLPEAPTLPEAILPPVIPEMPTVSAGEYDSIGILTIPTIELELPVLTDWSYDKLKKAPCHYYGSYYTSDFVIAAHNYASHFGKLPQLQPGDPVLFTDVTGQVHCYEVVLLETLVPTATEEMITSGFDLSLYTCTPGGAYRVTVRCTRQ